MLPELLSMCLTTIVASWFGKQMTMMNFSSLSKVNFPRFMIEFLGARHNSSVRHLFYIYLPLLVNFWQNLYYGRNHAFNAAEVTSQINVTPYDIRTY